MSEIDKNLKTLGFFMENMVVTEFDATLIIKI